MTNPFVRPEKQLKYIGGATTGQTVAVPPAARSICAILLAIGVEDEDLDGVNDVLISEPGIADHVPTSMEEIAIDCRKAWAIHLTRKTVTIDAV